MAKQLNLARVTTATTGTGTITLGSAVSGYLTFALAGVANGDVVSYGIKDGASSEIGYGTYTSAGTTLTRTVTKSTNSNAAISLSGIAEVFITARAEDISSWPQCGRLTYVSATAIKFAPFNGDQIKINGDIYRIPSAGIAGVANTSVFVNGTGASNLGASTLYYVYAFINSGVVTADFSTTAHSTSTTEGNVGTEIKTGDNTRTLVGMVRTNASSQFADSAAQRFVLSWFNRQTIGGYSAFTVNRTSTSTSLAEVNTEIRNEFLIWAGEAVHASIAGTGRNSNANRYVFTAISFDGGTADFVSLNQNSSAAGQVPVNISGIKNGLSEGYHYATLFGSVAASGGTATWDVSAIDGVTMPPVNLSTMIRG